MSNKKVHVLFVCLGNICRSPTAHGVFRELVARSELSEQITIDSAGTSAYHIDEAPDSRSVQAAMNRGINISDLKARQVCTQDFEHFDYILAMDLQNLQVLQQMKSKVKYSQSKLQLLLDYAAVTTLSEVPDPYYGSAQGFNQVLDLVEQASQGLLAAIKKDLM